MNTSAPIAARKRWLVVLAAITVAAVVLIAVDPTALCLLPALALAAPLLMRRYPGEQMIAALSGAGLPCRAHPRLSARRARRPVVAFPSGGLLMALSLAVRPPPAVSLACS
jgi:ABC-type enterobactin transport system permease subunit